jgi:hypothetical protein
MFKKFVIILCLFATLSPFVTLAEDPAPEQTTNDQEDFSAYTVRLRAYYRACFHEKLKQDEVATVYFEVDGKEDLKIDFEVRISSNTTLRLYHSRLAHRYWTHTTNKCPLPKTSLLENTRLRQRLMVNIPFALETINLQTTIRRLPLWWKVLKTCPKRSQVKRVRDNPQKEETL